MLSALLAPSKVKEETSEWADVDAAVAGDDWDIIGEIGAGTGSPPSEGELGETRDKLDRLASCALDTAVEPDGLDDESKNK